MRVRIRAPNGVHTITLEDVARVGDLLDAIREKASISGGVVVKSGFPPKALELPSRETLLIDLPITIHGEQLIVSEAESVSSPAPAGHVKSNIGPNSGPLSNSQGTLINQHERDLSFPSNESNPFKDWFSPTTEKGSKESNTLKGQEPIVQVDGMPGWSCTMRVMEDDNSCMFRAFNYVQAKGLDMMSELRGIVAQVIQADADLPEEDQKYTPVILGTSRDKYCRTITNPQTWGGYIDLTILSEFFDLTIYSLSVDDGGMVPYNEGRPQFAILIYSGIHYDCIALIETQDAPEKDTTVFDRANLGPVLGAAEKLCRILKERGYATNTAKFDLRCGDCGKALVGEKQARKHAEETGHTNFTEFK